MNAVATNGSVKFTVENAPRAVEELSLLGRFRLKNLAMDIGLGETPENRSALTAMKVEDLAGTIAQQLARLDANVGVAAPAPAPEPTQTTEPEAPKRTNRAPRVTPPTGVVTPPVASIDLKPVLERLEVLQTTVADLAGQLSRHENNTVALQAELKLQTQLTTALSLLFAEEVLHGTRQDILASAVVDLPGLSGILDEELKAGKENKGGK